MCSACEVCIEKGKKCTKTKLKKYFEPLAILTVCTAKYRNCIYWQSMPSIPPSPPHTDIVCGLNKQLQGD